MNNTNTQKNLKFSTSILILLAGLRALGTTFAGIFSFQAGSGQNIYVGVVSLLFALLYIVGIIGVVKKSRTAISALIFLGLFDLLSAFQIGGANGLGAGVFDVIICVLAYFEYKRATVVTQ